ncbi:MAG: hypothetical protein KAV70_03320 [Bacteroidales bacterium]|nr:hypothetical protein [Bacteroidales bacterium]
MKIIISHDIDHISVSEHFRDFIIPKFIIRSKIEFLTGKISLKQYFLRLKHLLQNKWQNIDELMEFNLQNNIPATFFIGVNKGLRLNYSLKLSEKWIKKILEKGFDCGVHGIAYQNQADIDMEYKTFSEISGLDKFGIRMHYLRMDTNTLEFLSKANYIFDSSIYSMDFPYKTGNIWEFPLNIMDGFEIEAGKKWQSKNLSQAKESTLKKIELAEKKKLEYLTILFHDRYFNNSFKTWMDWYCWLVDWLKQNNFKFINYRTAIDKLRK